MFHLFLRYGITCGNCYVMYLVPCVRHWIMRWRCDVIWSCEALWRHLCARPRRAACYVSFVWLLLLLFPLPLCLYHVNFGIRSAGFFFLFFFFCPFTQSAHTNTRARIFAKKEVACIVSQAEGACECNVTWSEGAENQTKYEQNIPLRKTSCGKKINNEYNHQDNKGTYERRSRALESSKSDKRQKKKSPRILWNSEKSFGGGPSWQCPPHDGITGDSDKPLRWSGVLGLKTKLQVFMATVSSFGRTNWIFFFFQGIWWGCLTAAHSIRRGDSLALLFLVMTDFSVWIVASSFWSCI